MVYRSSIYSTLEEKEEERARPREMAKEEIKREEKERSERPNLMASYEEEEIATYCCCIRGLIFEGLFRSVRRLWMRGKIC